MIEAAAEYRVSWHTAHPALIAAAARWLPEPSPTMVLGIDETWWPAILVVLTEQISNAEPKF